MTDGGITPGCPLEKALLEHDPVQVVRFVAEGDTLRCHALASRLDHPAFSDKVAMLVLKLALPRRALFHQRYGRCGEAYRELARRAFEPLPDRPTAAEKRLIAAVVNADSAGIVKLVRKKPGTLRNFSPELLTMLPELTREAVVVLLTEGFSLAAMPELFRTLVAEAETPEAFAGIPYRKRIMYANLLIHHLQGEPVSPDEEWYPMGNTVEDDCDRGVWCRTHSYCFDPRHLYRPRSTADEYEKPARRIAR